MSIIKISAIRLENQVNVLHFLSEESRCTFCSIATCSATGTSAAAAAAAAGGAAAAAAAAAVVCLC